MAVFNFLKKSRNVQLPLPPPPSPPQMPPRMQGDFEDIRAQEPLLLPPPMEAEDGPREYHEELPGFSDSNSIPAMEKEESSVAQDKTIAQMRVPQAREVPKPNLPARSFVAVDDYRVIMNETNSIRSRLMGAENFVRKLSELKNEEERALERWRLQLEDVEKKMAYVDQLIEKAQR